MTGEDRPEHPARPAPPERPEEETIRCRRLGNDVPLAYCLRQGGEGVCRLVCDCWWEKFDVVAYLRERLDPEEFARVTAKPPPPPKIKSIFEIMQDAQRRAEEKRGGGD